MARTKKLINQGVTLREFEDAMLQLGYKKKVSELHYVFFFEKFDSLVFISNLYKTDDFINPVEVIANADNMSWKGVLQDKHDLVKMIESKRLDAQGAIG